MCSHKTLQVPEAHSGATGHRPKVLLADADPLGSTVQAYLRAAGYGPADVLVADGNLGARIARELATLADEFPAVLCVEVEAVAPAAAGGPARHTKGGRLARLLMVLRRLASPTHR